MEPAVETELFNGGDLTGWVQRGGQATYDVEDGTIVGRSVPDNAAGGLAATAVQKCTDALASLDHSRPNWRR